MSEGSGHNVKAMDEYSEERGEQDDPWASAAAAAAVGYAHLSTSAKGIPSVEE